MSLVHAALADLQIACAGTKFEATSPLVEAPKKVRAPKHKVKTGAEPARKPKAKATTKKGKEPAAADKKRLTILTHGKTPKGRKHTVKASYEGTYVFASFEDEVDFIATASLEDLVTYVQSSVVVADKQPLNMRVTKASSLIKRILAYVQRHGIRLVTNYFLFNAVSALLVSIPAVLGIAAMSAGAMPVAIALFATAGGIAIIRDFQLLRRAIASIKRAISEIKDPAKRQAADRHLNELIKKADAAYDKMNAAKTKAERDSAERESDRAENEVSRFKTENHLS